jgi:hypothetical protein
VLSVKSGNGWCPTPLLLQCGVATSTSNQRCFPRFQVHTQVHSDRLSYNLGLMRRNSHAALCSVTDCASLA